MLKHLEVPACSPNPSVWSFLWYDARETFALPCFPRACSCVSCMYGMCFAFVYIRESLDHLGPINKALREAPRNAATVWWTIRTILRCMNLDLNTCGVISKSPDHPCVQTSQYLWSCWSLMRNIRVYCYFNRQHNKTRPQNIAARASVASGIITGST